MTNEERAALIAQCRAAVEAEPEFPDEMPDEMWRALRAAVRKGDRAFIAESYRLTVQLIKDSILERMPQ